jgi:hypothetical protein
MTILDDVLDRLSQSSWPDEEDEILAPLPQQPDEFTCSVCFLIHHRSQLARRSRGEGICFDCA